MIATSKRTPNSEQEKAIYHTGGKLLSAGAGSGKTFVLIEHLVHLLLNIQKKTPVADYNKKIHSELSKIVLMTFTKKAAGEMSVRMMRKVEEILNNAEEMEIEENVYFWNQVRQCLSSLSITTIHGFCHRLLGLGYWNEFPQKIELVSKIEHKDKIQKLFDKWFKVNRDNLDPLFLASSQSLLFAMEEIFESPELRVMWANYEVPQNAANEINRFFNQLLQVRGYENLFLEEFDLQVTTKEEKKKWYELLRDFHTLFIIKGKVRAENYLSYSEFFKALARFPVTNSKEISLKQKEKLGQIRNFRDDLKDLAEDLEVMTKEFEVYQKWIVTIADLFNYVEAHYFEIDGFSFSDLEYYALKALRQPDVLIKIQQSYTYFIVDEFQDTSFIQFEILKSLIGDNLEKLFCVGDRKQAIYGFRGGELQVFSECSQLLGESNNYYLKNNFRSLSAIIDFNNHLFEKVFPLGLKYEGHDSHSVQMEKQNIPVDIKEKGEVLSFRTQVIGEESEIDLDMIEAQILCSHIEMLLSQSEIDSICILYRKLKPSALLLELFLEKGISFSAQIKIQFANDPLINLLLYLIELYLNKDDVKKLKATMILFETLLSVIGVKIDNTFFLKQFFNDLNLIGLRLAFHKFVFSLGLSNSFHAQNADVVEALCRLTKEDIVKMYNLLKDDNGEDYACEMMSGGSTGKRIIIMSAHASKGLEYDAVLLGGVHTNGRYNGMKDLIGKFPHSFKWKKSFDQKKYFKSPFYYLESEILKVKDFSESKRLLYVACTRAVKQLVFVDLWSVVKGEPKDLFTYDNSWIQALRLMEIEQIHKNIENVHTKKVDISLIQQDSLGLVTHDQSTPLGVLSELSVTRLATIADCPFKFYLQNICKISPDEKSSIFSAPDEDSEEEIFYSSKKRGTELHGYLSKLFLKEITEGQLPIKEKDRILWALEQAKEYTDDFEIISERMIKFSFFGQMISGTPDLVFLSTERLVVWDFKTGSRDEVGEEGYWFQLMSYAYAYGRLKQFTSDKVIELVLLYLDQKNTAVKKMSMNDITNTLFMYWKKTESLDQVNHNHCPNCEYTTICQKGKS